MGFRKGRDTRDAIFQLRTIVQRSVQVNKKVYACFVDYQKAFDRINHEKLLSIMGASLNLSFTNDVTVTSS